MAPITPWASRRRPARPHVVVCGDNPLAHRLVEELTTRYGESVTVIVRSRKRNHAPQIAELPGVRMVEAAALDTEAFQAARLTQARSLALVDQDDVGNIHAALRAQELNPDLRLVIRMFSATLRKHVHALFSDCAVLSDSTLAAPAFVSAALGRIAPSHVRLPDRTLAAAIRHEVPPEKVVCTLATNTDPTTGPRVLSDNDDPDDLVLAFADGSADPLQAGNGGRRWLTRLGDTVLSSVSRGLWAIVVLLLALIVVSVVARVHYGFDHSHNLGYAIYVTVLNLAGAGNPDNGYPTMEKVLEAVTMVAGIALIPAITAALVDSAVRARLALMSGSMKRPQADHVIVSGLGNVGTRVIEQLADLGVPVIGIETNEQAPGVELARRREIPVIIGDATQEETLRTARVDTCRAVVTVTSKDIANLETALVAKARRPDVHLVLRVFDGDLAARIQEQFGIAVSRSVSYLGAPAFAAAVVERQVIGTIPVGRRVLLIADIPVAAGSELAGATVQEAHEAGLSRIIALYESQGDWDWVPDDDKTLEPGRRIVVLATRAGLGHILARSVPVTAGAADGAL